MYGGPGNNCLARSILLLFFFNPLNTWGGVDILFHDTTNVFCCLEKWLCTIKQHFMLVVWMHFDANPMRIATLSLHQNQLIYAGRVNGRGVTVCRALCRCHRDISGVKGLRSSSFLHLLPKLISSVWTDYL